MYTTLFNKTMRLPDFIGTFFTRLNFRGAKTLTGKPLN